MFVWPGSIVQCPDCGESMLRSARDEHVCDAERRLDYQLEQLRGEIEQFDLQVAAHMASPRGRFELWYAARERKRRR